MTELPGADTGRRPVLLPVAAGVAVLLVLGGLSGLGWQELGLIAFALLLLSWPALAFYAWARRRGDL
jgi:hypothetical protein